MLPLVITKTKKKLRRISMMVKVFDGLGLVTSANSTKTELLGMRVWSLFLHSFQVFTATVFFIRILVHSFEYYRIIDRKKDLVKLQGGEYVSYGKVESVLKTHALIESICLYADPTKDYVVAVAVPNQPALKELAESMDITDTSPDALCKNQKILTTVITTLNTYGSKNGLEKFELPKKITLVTDEWTPDSGLVTAAFKIRRIFIVKKYEDEIKNMY